MVRKMNKSVMIIFCVVMLLCATCGTAAAAEYDVYEGNISSSLTTYAKDILPNANIKDNYVFFRSGQYTYDIIVGDLLYENGVFTLADNGKQYTIDTQTSSFTNNYYTYSVKEITDFTLTTGNCIVYSDLGDFPELEERSAKFEIIQTCTICVACLFVVIRSIFNSSLR